MAKFDLVLEIDKEEPEAAEVLVDGEVDGQAFRFLLDTGSSKTVVRHDPFTAGYPSRGPHSLMGLFGRIDCDLIGVGQLAIGSLRAANLEIARMSAGGPPRSQIGMDLLKDFRLSFDFSARKVRNGAEDSPGPESFHELILDQKGIPYVKLSVGDSSPLCFWDSGAGITCVDLDFISANPAAFAPLGQLGIEDTAETGNVDMPLFLLTGLRHGNLIFPPHKVVGVDLSPIAAKIGKPVALVLGYNTLAKAKWILDFPSRKWAITGMS